MAANLRRDDDERRRQDASHTNTAPTPRPPTINRNPSLRIRKKNFSEAGVVESLETEPCGTARVENCVKQTLVEQEWWVNKPLWSRKAPCEARVVGKQNLCKAEVVGREMCEVNPCEAGVGENCVKQTLWSRSGERTV